MADSDESPSTEGRAITLTHVYGVLGVVPGILGVIAAFNQNKTWAELLLLGSGWLSAVFLAILLFRQSAQFDRLVRYTNETSGRDGKTIGRLEERTKQLSTELERRSATADFLAGLIGTSQATFGRKKAKIPPVADVQPPEGGEP